MVIFSPYSGREPMKSNWRIVLPAAFILTVVRSAPGNSASSMELVERSSYAGLAGQIVLDNERVTATRFIMKPGQRTGRHSHPNAALIVYVKGGVLKSEATGRSVLWRDGRVDWQDASASEEESFRNAGTSTIQFVEVVLKPSSSKESESKHVYEHLNYPNIPTEDLLENDRVIVQRFQMKPGQWEGVHAHPANTMYIFVKGGAGGHWVSQTTNPPSRVTGFSPDGDVGWMQPVAIEAGHQSSNTGTVASDTIWIALKD
jgi:quercetin dioxygenase-like cupin family protein